VSINLTHNFRKGLSLRSAGDGGSAAGELLGVAFPGSDMVWFVTYSVFLGDSSV